MDTTNTSHTATIAFSTTATEDQLHSLVRKGDLDTSDWIAKSYTHTDGHFVFELNPDSFSEEDLALLKLDTLTVDVHFQDLLQGFLTCLRYDENLCHRGEMLNERINAGCKHDTDLVLQAAILGRVHF